MKTLKSVITFVLLAVMVFTLFGCGGSGKETPTEQDFIRNNEDGSVTVILKGSWLLGYEWDYDTVPTLCKPNKYYYSPLYEKEYVGAQMYEADKEGKWYFDFVGNDVGEENIIFTLRNYNTDAVIGSYVNIHFSVDEDLKVTATVVDYVITDTTEFDNNYIKNNSI